MAWMALALLVLPSICGSETPSPVSAVDPAREPAAGAAAERDPYPAIVGAADRSEADRELDAGRQPVELLRLVGAQPGQRIGDIGAGGGYTTELLARAVSPGGAIYGQNSPALLQRFLEKPWSERLAKPLMQSVTRLDRELDAPFPEGIEPLDAVVNVLFYHDTVWMGVDRTRMNQNVFDALRPGGVYVIVDHSARDGAGLEDVQTLHRIEEAVVRREVESAGFVLASEGDFLRAPDDARDWSASPRTAGKRRGQSDRFALKFVKP